MIGRISERRAFERLRRDGRRTGTEHLWCRYLDDPSVVAPRVGFAIGRAVGSAVARNRLRRRLRALVAAASAAGAVGPGWLLIGARPGAAERSFDQLRCEVARLLAGAMRRADR